MTRFVLDAGPANLLAKFSTISASPQFLVAEEVRRELLDGINHPEYPKRRALFDDGVLLCREISLEEAVGTVEVLRKVKTKRFDEGEIQSVGVCMLEPDAVFVTQDKAALFVASAELGAARAWTSLDFWSWLHGEQHISDDQVRALMTAARNNAKDLLGPVMRFQKWFTTDR